MTKDRLLELIRKEEVLLFVGAGMSTYAGYPSGAKLASILYDGLPPDLKSKVEYPSNLPKLADDIYHIMGANKNYLFSTLKKEFQKQPTSIVTHELLAKIPHFKTIITTNYDTLIESTNTEIEVVRKSKDYSIINKNKQVLFKIHGDFTDTDGIILTESDYLDYFSTSAEQKVFWTAVKDRLASNHVVFVGYSLEDSNIISIIDKIGRELGDNKKEFYLVSPNASPTKEATLRNKGIAYIPLSGQDLIKEVFDDLKLNYFPDLSKGSGTADTALDFANKNGIDLNISKKHRDIVIESFKSTNPDIRNKAEFRLLLPPKEVKRLKDGLEGKTYENLDFNGEFVKDLNYYIGDFRIITEDKFKKIELIKLPGFVGPIDIILDDGTVLTDLEMKLYASKPKPNEYCYRIDLKDFVLTSKIKYGKDKNNPTGSFSIEPKEVLSNITSGINIYEMILKIFSNIGFKLFKGSDLVFTSSFNFKIKNSKPILFYEYLKKLKKIENHYKIIFRNIKLSETNDVIVRNILAYIDKSRIEYDFSNFNIKIPNDEEAQKIIEEGFDDKVMVYSKSDIITLSLHNLNFIIGKVTHVVYDAYIVNPKDLEEGGSKEIEIKSKSGKSYLFFADESLIDPPAIST